MNSIGLCRHNNMETSCPTCIRAKTVTPKGWVWPRTLSQKGMMGYADCNCGPMSGDCGCGTMGFSFFKNLFKPITTVVKPVITKPPVTTKPPIVQQPVKTPVIVQQPVKSPWQDYLKPLPPYDSRGWPLGSHCYSGKIEAAIAKPAECYRPYAEYLKSQEVKKRPGNVRAYFSGTNTMGALQCMPGFYEADVAGLKVCLPYGKTVLQSTQQAGQQLLTQGVVGSPGAKKVVAEKAKLGLAQQLVEAYDKNPRLFQIGGAIVIGSLLYNFLGTGAKVFRAGGSVLKAVGG